MNAFRDKPEPEQRKHDWFRWPHAMESGSLPWEASRAGLDLLAYYREHFGNEARPTITHVLAFWRITQAAPDLDIEERSRLAGALSAGWLSEQFDEEEFYLAFASWRSPEHQRKYERYYLAGKTIKVSVSLEPLSAEPAHHSSDESDQQSTKTQKGKKNGRSSARKTNR